MQCTANKKWNSSGKHPSFLEFCLHQSYNDESCEHTRFSKMFIWSNCLFHSVHDAGKKVKIFLLFLKRYLMLVILSLWNSHLGIPSPKLQYNRRYSQRWQLDSLDPEPSETEPPTSAVGAPQSLCLISPGCNTQHLNCSFVLTTAELLGASPSVNWNKPPAVFSVSNTGLPSSLKTICAVVVWQMHSPVTCLSSIMTWWLQM